jgi:hypothetical protein
MGAATHCAGPQHLSPLSVAGYVKRIGPFLYPLESQILALETAELPGAAVILDSGD